MVRERSGSGCKPVGATDEPDRAEEAGDDVEATAEVEVAHVALLQRDVGHAPACDVEQPRVEVEPFALEARVQMLEVLAGAARDVEQRRRVGVMLADDPLERRHFACVVLERVLEVVELGRSAYGTAPESVTISCRSQMDNCGLARRSYR